MTKQSAGILLYKIDSEMLKFFLVHPGGPFWKNKDLGSWSIPKGELNEAELPFAAAVREFQEETGLHPQGDFIPLTPVRLKSGKQVLAWAVAGDIDADSITCNTFELEWPPRSGIIKAFPEVDRGAWFDTEQALAKINPAQAGLLHELIAHLTI